MSPARSTWWWWPIAGDIVAVTSRTVETTLREPGPDSPGRFRHDARKLMAQHRAGVLGPIVAPGFGSFSYGESPQLPEARPASASPLRLALEKIRDARDTCARTGSYPPAPDGPDVTSQGFDDWAADLADAAIKGSPPSKA